MAAGDEDVKTCLAWFQDQCDKRDHEIDRLRQHLADAEQSIVCILLDNDKLYKAFENANVDRQLYDSLLINQSLLEEALEVYEQEIKESKERADKAEAAASEANKQYENLVAVKDFLTRQVRILNKEQNGNGIVDLLRGSLRDASSNSTPAAAALSEKFVRNTSAHVAFTQAAIGQFCGAYKVRLDANDSDTTSIATDHSDLRGSAGQANDTFTPPSFCTNCDELRVELEELKRNKSTKIKDKSRIAASLRSKLAKKSFEMQSKKKQLDAYRKNIKRQNSTIAELLKKLGNMENDISTLTSEKRTMQKQLKDFDGAVNHSP